MRNLFRIAVLGLATTSLLNCAGDDLVPDVTDDGTTIDRQEGRALTPPKSGPAPTIAREYLRGRVGNVADQLRVVNEYSARGVTHVRFEQVADGMRVYGSYSKAALSGRGELLQVIHKIAPAGAITQARATERDALTTVLIELGYPVVPVRVSGRNNLTTFDRGMEMFRNPTVERVVYLDGRALRQGYLVETWSKSNNQLDHTLIGYDGTIVSTERRTNNDKYNVYAEDPGKGGQSVVDGPGAGNAESPAGWLNAGTQLSANISGNNVRAYLDAVSNNSPDAGGTTVANGEFLATADLGSQPSTTGNRDVAVQNLFYLNNVLHDALYSHGFTEAAGNFQTNNFGAGGAGNDAVLAEAQDGGGVDNANFSTPADGSPPRMQMYLWSGSAPSATVAITSPAGAAGSYGAYPSTFGPALTTTGVTDDIALASPADACGPVTGVSGKFAIVDRGTCDFTVKVRNAQAAGAVGVLIANNVTGIAFAAGGTDRKVTIPSAMISQADGATLKANLAGLAGSLKKNAQGPLQNDGDLDSDIVFHEYGHGLTWRMIGGMSGMYAGAIGEGAADTLAFLLNCGPSSCDDRIGEYSYGDPLGIRRQPYQGYTLSYNDWTGAEVHDDGEIFAAAMWGVLQNYLAAGLTASDVLDDFVDGMNFTPSTPKPETMRDGMLQGAESARACLIWRGFARVGIGQGASGGQAIKKGKPVAVVTESTAVPAGCE